MSSTLHPNLLSAFLAGKSCSAIALAFNLSVEDVLTWFESDLTQSTLRRLEALQLQQARIGSGSVLPHAAGSLTNTCDSADNPALRTRAASNLVRLGLRFTAPSRNSAAPSQWEGVGGGFVSLPNRDNQTSRDSEAPSLREGVGGGESIPTNALTTKTPPSSSMPATRRTAQAFDSRLRTTSTASTSCRRTERRLRTRRLHASQHPQHSVFSVLSSVVLCGPPF